VGSDHWDELRLIVVVRGCVQSLGIVKVDLQLDLPVRIYVGPGLIRTVKAFRGEDSYNNTCNIRISLSLKKRLKFKNASINSIKLRPNYIVIGTFDCTLIILRFSLFALGVCKLMRVFYVEERKRSLGLALGLFFGRHIFTNVVVATKGVSEMGEMECLDIGCRDVFKV
jgi:hypothetical protein